MRTIFAMWVNIDCTRSIYFTNPRRRWCARDTMALGDFVRLVAARSTYVRLVAAFYYWNNAASSLE